MQCPPRKETRSPSGRCAHRAASSRTYCRPEKREGLKKTRATTSPAFWAAGNRRSGAWADSRLHSLPEPHETQPSDSAGVCDKLVVEKQGGYQPAARCSQNSSQRPLSWEQRRAIIALAWSTVQRIPDCFSRCPMIVLQPASTTPEPTKRPWLRNWA